MKYKTSTPPTRHTRTDTLKANLGVKTHSGNSAASRGASDLRDHSQGWRYCAPVLLLFVSLQKK